MHASPRTPYAHRVLQVQHLVIEQILDRIAGTRWSVKNSTDNDCVVCGIVVTQQPLRVVLTPGELRSAQETVKKALVQRVENLFKIVVAPFRPAESLRSARVADLFSLSGYDFAVLKSFIAVIVRCADWLLIYLCNQDMSYGAQHRFGRALQKVG